MQHLPQQLIAFLISKLFIPKKFKAELIGPLFAHNFCNLYSIIDTGIQIVVAICRHKSPFTVKLINLYLSFYYSIEFKFNLQYSGKGILNTSGESLTLRLTNL